ncbi:hypothetical protein NKJ88_20595 [Mesorhizobium sp. M0016]|uniref:hypothetical protein n=1 Tax=Mesorhizobium sp. M0016 TaxID=2956843 RepID=UPI00333B007F
MDASRKLRRFGSVAKLTILDLEETDAGERVEEPRQTSGLDFERCPKAVGSRSIAAEPGEDAKVQPGTKRQGRGHPCDQLVDPIGIHHVISRCAIQDRL